MHMYAQRSNSTAAVAALSVCPLTCHLPMGCSCEPPPPLPLAAAAPGEWTLIDFGLARRYLDDEQQQLPERTDASFRGSSTYASAQVRVGWILDGVRVGVGCVWVCVCGWVGKESEDSFLAGLGWLNGPCAIPWQEAARQTVG